MKTEIIRRIDKVPNTAKKLITKELEATIKKHGLHETRLTITHYFLNYKATLKRRDQIAELKKEIARLNKKKSQ